MGKPKTEPSDEAVQEVGRWLPAFWRNWHREVVVRQVIRHWEKYKARKEAEDA